MPKFRYVSENSGGTFKIKDDDVPCIGTYKCVTCVGVSFRVEEKRIFFAHFACYSGLTAYTHAVTEEAGVKVRSQTMNRMQELARWGDWNPSDKYFGQDIFLFCPSTKGPPGSPPIIGGLVIQAIRHYFQLCAEQLYKQVAERGKHSLAQETEEPFKEESTRLEKKGYFLMDTSFRTQVERNYHGFILNPVERRHYPIGDFRKIEYVQESDLGHWRKHDMNWADEPEVGNCILGVETDRVNAFLSEWLAPNWLRLSIIEALRRSRAEYSTDLATADKLAMTVGTKAAKWLRAQGYSKPKDELEAVQMGLIV